MWRTNCILWRSKSIIINIDETDSSLDNTNGQFVFYSNDVGGGSSRANKISYSSAIISGWNASGDTLPLHFQLKTLSQTESGHTLSVDLFKYAKDCYGKFGHKDLRFFSCTWGMNDKAGMNTVELEKYFINAILSLYSDVEDVANKCKY